MSEKQKETPQALNPDWLATQPVHLQAGLLIAAWRQQYRFSDSREFAQLIGISAENLREIEDGERQINSGLKGTLKGIFAAGRSLGFKPKYFSDICDASNAAIKAGLKNPGGESPSEP